MVPWSPCNLMLFSTIISFAAVIAALAVAAGVFLRWGQSFVSLTLVAGLVLAALEAGLNGMATLAFYPDELLRWQYLGVLATTLQPGVWILFVMSFVRSGYEGTLARRKWLIAAVFVIPLVLTVLFGGTLFRGVSFDDAGWIVGIGWGGRILHVFLLLCAVVILMQLERTFRASAGGVRWEIKFLILGVGTLWAVRIYMSSQTLLFSSVSPQLQVLFPAFLFLASLLMAISLWRSRAVAPGLYVSQSLVFNSLIALFVGLYLIVVGLFAKMMSYLGDGTSIPLDSFFLFICLIGLSALLLSDDLRERTKRFLTRHLQRPQFDYRKVWRDFTRETSALLEEKELAASVTRLLARTFGVASAGIWSWNDSTRTLDLMHGTFLPDDAVWQIPRDVPLDALVFADTRPCELGKDHDGWAGFMKDACPDQFFPSHVRYVMPLVVKEKFLGVVTMNEKITGEPFSPEELELFRTLSEQIAASLLNLQLSRDLRSAREAEAFQRMSAFFVHDLKNVAAGLSLTVNNLPRHFDNPEFRADALKSITRSVDKMNAMCSRLGSLKSAPRLELEQENLNGLVESSLTDLNGIQSQVRTELQNVGTVCMDAGEMKKVVQNLILNAVDASGKEGRIDIATEERDGATVLSVSDHGCGMSREFIDKKLFHPFTSTKEKGLGIGLFQCKQIVEAHEGRIEVESEEGKGSTFRVYLPRKGNRTMGQ